MHVQIVICSLCKKQFEVAYIRPLPVLKNHTVCIRCASAGRATRHKPPKKVALRRERYLRNLQVAENYLLPCASLLLLCTLALFTACDRAQQMLPVHPVPIPETRTHNHPHHHFHKHSPDHPHEHGHPHGHPPTMDDVIHDFQIQYGLEHDHEVECIAHHDSAFDAHEAHDVQVCINEAEALLDIESVILKNVSETETQIFRNE